MHKMSKNTLDNLFGSKIRVKILKYAFRNYPSDFNIQELSQRIRESSRGAKSEVDNMLRMGLIKIKSR